MPENNVLVLGSKPDSKLPDLKVSKIYTANGAAERADYFRKKYVDNELICITGASEFVRNEHVSKRIKNSKPSRLIIRSGIINLPTILNSHTELKCISNLSQWSFQSNFFRFSFFALLISEFCHQEKILDKIIHVVKAIKNKKIQGVSTGFFAILLALIENPNTNIIISGIGMKGGKQFYKSERSNYFVYDSRARVDRFLVKLLLKKHKSRLYTLDTDLAEIAGIGIWNGDILKL